MEDLPDLFDCRLCGKPIAPQEWGGGECDACGSVSVTTVPTEEELKEFYLRFNETYDGGHAGGGNLIRYANRYLALLQRHLRAGKFIDIGSSTSPFPNIAANAGFSVTVMDYVRPRDLDSRVTFVDGTLNDRSSLSTCGGTYDAVTAWAVIEHVSNPRLSCALLSDICKPGGVILLSTPEIGTFLTRNSIGRSGWFNPPMHLHLLSPLVLQTIFAQNDCDLLEWGRLELNSWRYVARYGIGLAETVIGTLVKCLSAVQWKKFRASRTHKFKGITYFAFRKRPATPDKTLQPTADRRG